MTNHDAVAGQMINICTAISADYTATVIALSAETPF